MPPDPRIGVLEHLDDTRHRVRHQLFQDPGGIHGDKPIRVSKHLGQVWTRGPGCLAERGQCQNGRMTDRGIGVLQPLGQRRYARDGKRWNRLTFRSSDLATRNNKEKYYGDERASFHHGLRAIRCVT